MPGAVILAGGLSSRFGSDKAQARWRGRTLLDHVLAGLPAERKSTVLVLRPEQELDAPAEVTVVRDDPDLPAGPLRGLVRGLEESAEPWNWVVACDQPALAAPLLRHLATLAGPGCDAVIPRWRGRVQPLVGLYRTGARDLLLASLEDGRRAMQAALDGLTVRWADEGECGRHDPEGRSFLNINHPEQLAALERFGATEGGPETETTT